MTGGQHPWPGLEVRYLAALEAVSREGSFRGAADALGYVQSAVSQQIATLERVVGARLLERARGRRGVELTPAGRVLLEHGSGVIDRLRAARADLVALAENAPKTVRAGIDRSAAPWLLPALLGPLAAADAPDVELSELDGHAELVDRLADGNIDLAIGEAPRPDAPVTAEHLLVDACVLLLHVDHPLARQPDPPTLDQIVALSPAAVLPQGDVERVRAFVADAGLALSIPMQTRSPAVGWTLAAGGHRAAIGWRLELDPPPPGLAAIGLDAMLPTRAIALTWRRDRLMTGAIDAFRCLVHEAIALAPRGTSERVFRAA